MKRRLPLRSNLIGIASAVCLAFVAAGCSTDEAGKSSAQGATQTSSAALTQGERHSSVGERLSSGDENVVVLTKTSKGKATTSPAKSASREKESVPTVACNTRSEAGLADAKVRGEAVLKGCEKTEKSLPAENKVLEQEVGHK